MILRPPNLLDEPQFPPENSRLVESVDDSQGWGEGVQQVYEESAGFLLGDGLVNTGEQIEEGVDRAAVPVLFGRHYRAGFRVRFF
jgi:hypothetical protein